MTSCNKYLFFLSSSHNSVPQEVPRKVSIVAQSWHRVPLPTPLQFEEERQRVNAVIHVDTTLELIFMLLGVVGWCDDAG